MLEDIVNIVHSESAWKIKTDGATMNSKLYPSY